MDRKKAFETVASLLEERGQLDVLAEVRRALDTLEAYERHGKTISDVTRSLLESEKTYRLVFSQEHDAMALMERGTGRFVEVNEAWVKLYGWAREEALAMTMDDIAASPPVARPPLDAASPVDVRWHRAKDGTVFPIEMITGGLELDGREVVYVLVRDIMNRNDVERALVRAQESYRALIDGMPDGVMVGRKGCIVHMSPSMRRILGYSEDDAVVGMRVLDLVHPDDRERASERIYKIASFGAIVPPIEERLRRKDGSYVMTELMAMKASFEGEPAIVAIVRDITRRKELEAQLLLNDRLASLGRLAASVGHELNNPLAYVLGNVGFMERELEAASGIPCETAERLSSYVRLIGEGARRMRDIVHDLKTLARSDGPENVHVDVQHMLDVCSNMAEHELRAGTKLVKDYKDSVAVLGNETRLGQVFLNLLVNAAQAIREGAPDRAHEVRVVVRASGTNAVVEISDTGVGVPRALMDRIFEPFFTTKAGVGTGLGLSISHRIVTSAGGTLTCEPRDGGGTTFRVTLPAVDAAPA